jgi:tetratricopeptide (TPR) repeat protein
MARQRKRGNPLRVMVLGALLVGALYINFVVVPVTPPMFIATITPTRSPESYLNEAQDLVAEGKINQAITMYEEALKVDPRNPAIYVTVARLQVLYGDYDSADENITLALMLNDKNALARAVHGWVLGKKNQYLQGETELQVALDLDPNSALAYAYRAELYKDMIDAGKGDFTTIDKAISDSQKAVSLDSSQLEVRRARGLVLEVTGNYAEAAEEFKAALVMNPNLAELYVALARNYRVLAQEPSDFGRALEALNRAIALRPDIAEPYAEQALTYFAVGDFANAIQMGQLAADRDPTNPLMHGLLGTMYYRNFQYQEAADEFRLAVRGGVTRKGSTVEPIPVDGGYTFVVYYVRFGLSLSYVGQCQEALQVAQQLLQAAPSDETALQNVPIIQENCQDAPAVTIPDAQPTATPGS